LNTVETNVINDNDVAMSCDEYFNLEKATQKRTRDEDAMFSTDTFGDSLRFVNKLYNKEFGKVNSEYRRRVPSHMPHMINKIHMKEMKAKWRKEFDATSAHRFRHPKDMQFSFSYMYYVVNRNKVHPPTLEDIWNEYIDVNKDGILDDNELLTVAGLAYGDYPTEEYVEEVRKCLEAPKQEKVVDLETAKGKVRYSEILQPHMSYETLSNCPNVTEKLIEKIRKPVTHIMMPEDEVYIL